MFKNVKKISAAAIILSVSMLYINAGAEEISVVPSGEAVGVKIYTEGLLVVGMSDNSPAKKSGVKVNDRIEYVNGCELRTSEQLADAVCGSEPSVTLTLDREGEKLDIQISPQKDSDGAMKLGLWVRDSTAGIGTLTYYNPENNTFAALGHGINDVDTGNILTVKSGNILPCKILSVTKSENGCPGELNGSFDGEAIGDICLNAENGIYGKCPLTPGGEALPVAKADEVREGEAYILADIDGSGAQKYDVEIEKVLKNGKSRKNMVVVIKDEKLLSLTGGIVQGMSGAPIIQNGKLAGALTHVFVNDSDKGYGTFAEDMIKNSENIN